MCFPCTLGSVSKITAVALALGPKRVVAELVPFLNDFTNYENDEVLASVARQLGHFCDIVGGPQNALHLFPILEKLAGEDEAVVRDNAVASFNILINKINKNDVVQKFVPILKRLAAGEWFTTRVSACGLFANTYPHVPDQIQTELRTLFQVRRALVPKNAICIMPRRSLTHCHVTLTHTVI